MISSLTTVALALSQNTGADIVYDTLHNVTSLYGTWSTGAGNVVTGSNFAQPAEVSFTYPPTTGVSFSFSEDHWFEVAQYSFVSNASDPSCITGYMLWMHGTFTEETNGSLVLTPNGDGYQQVQDACAAVSNFIENTNVTIYIPWWTIGTDTDKGFTLKLQKYDLTYYAPFYQISTTPEMFPTQKLRNVTTVEDLTSSRKRSFEEKRNDASTMSHSSSLLLAGGAFVVGLLSL
jgi:hypothetical protein